jgi:hypothetical protein
VQSGKHLLAASISGFDPTRTLAPARVASRDQGLEWLPVIKG